MPKIKTADGVNLYYEEAGAGTPVVFVQEFAGDYRTCEPVFAAAENGRWLAHRPPGA